MKKITVTVIDALDELVDAAWVELKELFEGYLRDNPDTEKIPDLSGDLNYSGGVDEIIDNLVANMSSNEIKDTWYLHEDLLKKAYEESGIGDDPRENKGQTAIYEYIVQAIWGLYDKHGKTLFETWQNRQLRQKMLEDLHVGKPPMVVTVQKSREAVNKVEYAF